MIKFIEKPYLPQGKVNLCVIEENHNIIKNTLTNLGIEVIECEKNEFLDFPLAAHSDMNIHHLGGNNIICNKNLAKLKLSLENKNFKIIENNSNIISPYPNDIRLNSFMLNGYLFCNEKYTDSSIFNFYKNNNVKIINVNQGYMKCTTCIVDENSVITADKGNYNIFKKIGIDVLLIENDENIILGDYPYGFIGGCSGLIDKNILAFTGDMSYHKDWHKIKAFLKKKNINYIFLSNEKPIDIGSIIPLTVEFNLE